MKREDIDFFFRRLSVELARSATVILTGAGAAALQGAVRPSNDLDFAIRLRGRSRTAWKKLEAAVQRTVGATGINANFAEDIDRWGMITLLDYDRHVSVYKSFGLLRVLLMHPAYWSIGKMTRYLTSDADDMAAVFKAKRVPWRTLVRVWRRALERSPRSQALALFQQHAAHFFADRGPGIWGRTFVPAQAVSQLSDR